MLWRRNCAFSVWRFRDGYRLALLAVDPISRKLWECARVLASLRRPATLLTQYRETSSDSFLTLNKPFKRRGKGMRIRFVVDLYYN